MASSGEKLVYFLMGGFVGASIALLFAPKSGEETRDFLAQKYREGTDELTRRTRETRDFVSGKSRELVDKVGQTVERSRDTLARQKEQLSAAIEAGRQVYQDEKRKLETEEQPS
ncbi:MAG: YtxH domain-containing protein [Acidobacteria bacterium]|nr:YtxH domain-containing protein [Acidobacteriota bacterium]